VVLGGLERRRLDRPPALEVEQRQVRVAPDPDRPLPRVLDAAREEDGIEQAWSLTTVSTSPASTAPQRRLVGIQSVAHCGSATLPTEVGVPR
jgi:hypothetical protein